MSAVYCFSLCKNTKTLNSIECLTLDEISHLNDVFGITFQLDINNDGLYEFEIVLH